MSGASVQDREPMPRVYVIVVSFGSGEDTIECLESLMRLDYREFGIIVCDNGPATEALELIRAWAAPLSHGGDCLFVDADESRRAVQPAAARLVVISTGENRGFAAAANLGITYAQQRGDADFYWLLNNDTVVAPNALTELVRHAERHPAAGLIGSTLLDYREPRRIQARGGGRYDPRWGITRLAGEGSTLDEPAGPTTLDFVHGASMLVTRSFVESVGGLEECYFLYFEDLDWAMRAGGPVRLGYAPESRVWHKDSGAVASPSGRSRTADYYAIRSRILFTRRFHPGWLPTVYLGLLGAALNRIRRRQWDRVAMILRLMLRPV